MSAIAGADPVCANFCPDSNLGNAIGDGLVTGINNGAGDEYPSSVSLSGEGCGSTTTELDADYLLDNNYRYTRELCLHCLEHDKITSISFLS